MNLMKKRNAWLMILALLFIVVFMVIFGRFIYIKVSGQVNHVSLYDWAKDKRSATIPLEAERGTIYDRDGNILAYNRPTYRLYAILDESYSENAAKPKHVINVDKAAEAIADNTDVDFKDAKKTLESGQKDKLFQVEFGKEGKELSLKQKKAIDTLNISGLYFFEDDGRYYPNGQFASNVMGFVKVDEDSHEIKGQTGIEKLKNKILEGKDGALTYLRDQYNRKLLNQKETVIPKEDGMNVYLTLNQRIQTLVEDAMTQSYEKFEPKKLTAVVMDAKTGEILALSNRPSYNPNEPKDIKNWYNDAVSTPVEMGSPMKIFTWAAAIDSGNYDGSKYYQSGKYSINDQVDVIGDHNEGQGWGEISFDEGFERSSNVAASKLVWEEMGPETFLDYLQAFDFDKETKIDLPDEVVGKITYNYPSDKLRTAFGQSSTATPVQMMKAATAIFNDGEMLQPYIIDKIVDTNKGETIEQNKRKVVGQPIKKETTKKVKALMDAAVNSEIGTGRQFQLNDYYAMGKTGTAQIPANDGSGYLSGKENHMFSFLGAAPKNDPEIIMYVSVTQPKLKASEIGYDPITLIFKHVMNNSLQYMNINPDIEEENPVVNESKMPQVIEQTVDAAEQSLKESGARVTVIGDGKKVEATNLREDQAINALTHIMLVTNQPKMPDLQGWSKRDVIELADLLDLEIELDGLGYVKKQSIKVDAKIKKGQKLSVKLK